MRIPKYSHHKATNRAFVKLNGKFHYLGPYNSPESRTRYAKLISSHLQDEPPQQQTRSGALTLSEAILLFLNRNRPEYPDSSDEPRQFPIALSPLLRLFGSLPADQFQAFHLDAVRKAMASGSWLTKEEREEFAARKIPTSLCREVINRRLNRIKLAFKRMELWQIIPPGVYGRLNTVTGHDTKARHSPEVEPASWDDVKAVVRWLWSTPKGRYRKRRRILASMLLLGWWTGARPGELRIMRPCDIDRSGPVWIYKPSTHKNAWRGQSREIFLGVKCQAILRPLLEGAKPEAWLFPSRTGEPYTVGGLSQAIADETKHVGVDLHFYMTRHSAKRRVEQQYGEAAAKAILGQESLDSIRRYAKKQDAELAKQVAKKTG